MAQLVDVPVPEAGPLAVLRYSATEGLEVEGGADGGCEYQIAEVPPDASGVLLGVPDVLGGPAAGRRGVETSARCDGGARSCDRPEGRLARCGVATGVGSGRAASGRQVSLSPQEIPSNSPLRRLEGERHHVGGLETVAPSPRARRPVPARASASCLHAAGSSSRRRSPPRCESGLPVAGQPGRCGGSRGRRVRFHSQQHFAYVGTGVRDRRKTSVRVVHASDETGSSPTVGSLSSALWMTQARDPLSDRTPIGEAQNDLW